MLKLKLQYFVKKYFAYKQRYGGENSLKEKINNPNKYNVTNIKKTVMD